MHAPAEGWLARILEESEQDRQSVARGPEQVPQLESQLRQVFTSDLNWSEAQLVQAPFAGWFAKIFVESEQDKQSVANGPEQVWQSPWQL